MRRFKRVEGQDRHCGTMRVQLAGVYEGSPAASEAEVFYLLIG
jgi:hypothetical protein